MNERSSSAHLNALEEIEKEGLSRLLEVLREEGLDTVRRALQEAISRPREYDSPAWCNKFTEEHRKIAWEMTVRIEKILCIVLHEAHERQIEKTIETLEEGPEDYYKIPY